MDESVPKLAPPGAGIPLLHRLFIRWFFLPQKMRKRDWDARQRAIRREGEKIVELLRATPAPALTQRALIAPMIGLEDSSRYWSVLMAVEHLIIVGDQVAQLIVALSQGHNSFPAADTAKVKPIGSLTAADGLDQFEAYLARFDERLASVQNRQSRLRFRHPWFGPLTAAQWQQVALMHQGLHRRQCESILAAASVATSATKN